ncbi:zygote arrest protein 1 [Phaenicophaeus curvirostris]|uniref:zygote arrest protein 1 n=1 Tax=Phaenicophaeus curvirostris TaxID=33595 RepID=UPI0037F0E632
MAEEAMESYLYAAYPPYSYRYPPPKGKGGWRPRGAGGFAGYREAAAAEYFDNYQRAQLKAILSQVNPNLTPRLRKANTKEVGVQVNPRQDASVQCSLGPRTLPRRRPDRERDPERGSPAARPLRFPRTVAVYSPVASRRLTALLPGGEPRDGGEKPPEGGAEPAAPQPRRDEGEEKEKEEKEKKEEEAAASPPAAPQQREASKTRLRFQFLEQKYGYYHCKDCNIRWESAYVWCVQGTNKVYFRQFCRTCQKSYNPYRVEDITCQRCKQTRCSCPVKMRHVDPKRPHRQDLCGRCKGKRLSCDSTFSFKYII